MLLTCAVVVPLLLKSRSVPRGEQAAFLRYSSGLVLVKLAGSGDRDGIYRFSDGVTLSDVKKMTNLPAAVLNPREPRDSICLKNGDVVSFDRPEGNRIEITVKNMKVTEMMLLGIPLDADSLSVEEWEELPGIGPTLARAIVSDRQKYGDFGGIEGVLRVPGIGFGKVNSLKRFFRVL